LNIHDVDKEVLFYEKKAQPGGENFKKENFND